MKAVGLNDEDKFSISNNFKQFVFIKKIPKQNKKESLRLTGLMM